MSRSSATPRVASAHSCSARFVYAPLLATPVKHFPHQDAAAASNLINTLHSTPPKPFLGRILRYEPARAFRTLLVSYRCVTHLILRIYPLICVLRTPKQLVPSLQGRDGEVDQAAREQLVDIEVPFAMRIWKSRTSKWVVSLSAYTRKLIGLQVLQHAVQLRCGGRRSAEQGYAAASRGIHRQ